MKNTYIATLLLLASGRINAQEAAAKLFPPEAAQPTVRILSESTVRNRDGSSITFRQVTPPVVVPQVQPTAVIPAQDLSAAEQAAVAQMPVKEAKMLSISASVHTNGFTVLRWTCGGEQALRAVSNVDFRYLEGVANLETAQASFVLLLSAGPADQAMTDAEALAAQALPANGMASLALLSDDAAKSPPKARRKKQNWMRWSRC